MIFDLLCLRKKHWLHVLSLTWPHTHIHTDPCTHAHTSLVGTAVLLMSPEECKMESRCVETHRFETSSFTRCRLLKKIRTMLTKTLWLVIPLLGSSTQHLNLHIKHSTLGPANNLNVIKFVCVSVLSGWMRTTTLSRMGWTSRTQSSLTLQRSTACLPAFSSSPTARQALRSTSTAQSGRPRRTAGYVAPIASSVEKTIVSLYNTCFHTYFSIKSFITIQMFWMYKRMDLVSKSPGVQIII